MFEQVFEHAGGGDSTPAPAGTGSGGGGQMRRYDDPVEVRKGWVSGPAHQGEGPEQFLWHGRLWKVRAVLAHWVETGAWWQQHDEVVAGSVGELLVERELWRVEAGRGGPDTGGVFDLSFDWTDGRWQLVGCAD